MSHTMALGILTLVSAVISIAAALYLRGWAMLLLAAAQHSPYYCRHPDCGYCTVREFNARTGSRLPLLEGRCRDA